MEGKRKGDKASPPALSEREGAKISNREKAYRYERKGILIRKKKNKLIKRNNQVD